MIIRRLIAPLTVAIVALHAAHAGAQGAFPAPLPNQSAAPANASPFPPVNGAPAAAAPAVSSPFPSQGAAPFGGAPQPPDRIVVRNERTQKAVVIARTPGISHVILAVEDNGSPSLTSYRRVILKIDK